MGKTMITSDTYTQKQFIDIRAALSYTILDSTGTSITLKQALKQQTLYGDASEPGTLGKVLVIFIRHFLCGNCQDYLSELLATLAKSNIPRTPVIIVGCGAYSLIQSYRELFNSMPKEWQIYTDPTTKLFALLGMSRNLSPGSRSPAYIKHSLFSNAIRSAGQAMRRWPHGDALAAGDLSVNGGEYLFTKPDRMEQSDWNLAWHYAMKNTRDHTEVEDLIRIVQSTHINDCSIKEPNKPILLDVSARVNTMYTTPALKTSRDRPHSIAITEVKTSSQSAETIPPPANYPAEESIRISQRFKRCSWFKRASSFVGEGALGRSAGAPPT